MTMTMTLGPNGWETAMTSGNALSLTAAELAALRGAAARKTISQLVAGGVFYVAHDGAGQFECESYTRRAYRSGALAGYIAPIIPDGANWRTTADGAIIDAHTDALNATVNGAAWTDGAGNATALTRAGARAVTLKGSTIYPFGGLDELGLVDLDAFLIATYGPWPHAPEPKTLAGAQAMMREYALHGLQDYSLVNFAGGVAAYATLAPQFAAAGFAHIGYILSSGEHASFNSAAATAMLAAGVNWVVIDRTQSQAVSCASVASAAGLRVLVWNLWRQAHIDAFAAGTVHAWAVETPRYLARAPGHVGLLKTNFASGSPGVGWIAFNDTNNAEGRGVPSSATAGYWRWAPPANSGPRGALIGSLVPAGAMPERYTITIPFTVVTRGTTDKRWGLMFAMGTNDEGADLENGTTKFVGWGIQIRHSNSADGTGSNGDIRYRNVSAGGVLGTVTSAATSAIITDGMSLTLTIQVTPTQVVASLSGAVTGTLTMTDATTRGKYPSIGVMGNIAGAIIDHGNVTITPN